MRQILDLESERILREVGEDGWAAGRPAETRAVFEQVALQEDLPDFLTVVAYELLD